MRFLIFHEINRKRLKAHGDFLLHPIFFYLPFRDEYWPRIMISLRKICSSCHRYRFIVSMLSWKSNHMNALLWNSEQDVNAFAVIFIDRSCSFWICLNFIQFIRLNRFACFVWLVDAICFGSILQQSIKLEEMKFRNISNL